MPRTKDQETRPGAPVSREKLELERRYGSIGISAVAAAARYHDGGRGKAPVNAAPPARRFEESAA